MSSFFKFFVKAKTRQEYQIIIMSLEEFETILKELPSLKAPGVSGSRIKRLTEIAFQQVGQESNLITILYSNCKAVPSTHKLGTLYVVDSIVRGFTEEAKKENQEINQLAPDGTFASAVYKITELIESLVDDALELQISTSQRIKISKLVDIWERAETFPPQIIKNIRDKHFASTTPPGSPPRTKVEPVKPVEEKSTNDSTSILSALASLAKSTGSDSNTPTSQPANPVSSNDASNILSQLSALSGAASATAPSSVSPPATAGSLPSLPPSLPKPPHLAQQQAPPLASNEQAIFNMLQQMQSGGGAPTGASAPPPAPVQQYGQQPATNDYSTGRRGRRDNQNDNGYGRRNRSRSPNRGGVPPNQYVRSRSPPRGHNQPYNHNLPPTPQRMHPQQQQQYQQHQPPQQQAPQHMDREMNVQGTPHYRPRNVGFDPSLPQASIKVLSRTLFIGGVPRNMDERALATALRPYAEVQSVILNSERKHAFVKVYSRREAEQVITSFNKDNALPLRTRWGVGFGPRDCCNYQHGISIIPIQRLTEADKSWIVNAQWGGTGGQPMLSGMVIDEPDIEIGSGISSKAMSRKMPTNSARNGPKSNRPGEAADEYVKTTLILPLGMSHGSMPNFQTFQQSSVNPLQGLFGNASPQPQTQQPNMQYQNQGGQMPPGLPPVPSSGFNDFLNNMQQQPGAPGPDGGQAGNPNLAALAQLIQQQQQQQHHHQ